MAFAKDNDALNMKAFVLLCNISPALREEFLKQDRIFIKITKVINQKPVPEILISRIAAVLQSFIFGHPRASTYMIGFLLFLIEHIENQCVFDLFSSITSPSFQIKEFAEIFAQLKFEETIIKELEDPNSSPEKRAHICYIIRNCSKNLYFSKYFHSQVVVDALCDLIPLNNVYADGHLWQAISAICDETTQEMMEGILFKAFQFVIIPTHDVHMALTCAWDFIGKMLLLVGDERFGESFQLPNVAINLLVQFPNNSNLVGALFRYIRNALKIPGYCTKVLTAFVPFMITAISENEKTAASASCRMFIGDLTVLRRIHPEANKAIKNIDLFHNIKDDFVDHYFECLSESYGGEAPPPQNNGVITLQNLMRITD
ncbi:hypothetical protein TRFO_40064 [Tritrichomonas foetus]|uniref:Uncharacterized protein n=1 Tax=Tritrichomonas foetus TaxID=1144522 RepID=A0A1J4J7Q1_9EUKA|nr:hypothetical protein TRFO_40064 [Tritrichomonas foetus]|eukprot:OHS93683.1 hypothetical protein TRFO_40064 [Tritrichomonas foetus]